MKRVTETLTPALLRAFLSPVPWNTQRALEQAASRVPEDLRNPRQFLGRQYAGCGATIGTMPRCDFACRGCYLGPRANQISPIAVSEVFRQMDRIRAWLGEGGNVQITDGEVTLREESELVAIIRYSREIGLIPMLMTHGEGLRRDSDFLARLMVQGGLTELSIHVDTTQRGRSGSCYKLAVHEEELNPLREEFADLIRRLRRKTHRPLKVVSTVTVTKENLAGVPSVMRCMLRNADVFSLISFQPIAQVGRTEGGLGGSASVEELWRRIAEGLYGDPSLAESLLEHQVWFGHPGCNRSVQGLTVTEEGRDPEFMPLVRSGHAQDESFLFAWADRFGGIQFRGDTRLVAACRLLGLVRSAPALILGGGSRFLLRQLSRVARGPTLPFLWRWFRRRARVDYFNVVSHHFMSASELDTPDGQERLDLCVFKVPVGDQFVSMCELNSRGARDQFYAQMKRSAREPIAT